MTTHRKTYAGIGRQTLPHAIQELMVDLGYAYASLGYVLRSGGAKGADDAFEWGAILYANETGKPFSEVMEIYLPDKRFKGRHARNDGYHHFENSDLTEDQQAFTNRMIETWHPAPHRLGRARKFMERNCMQIMGADLSSPSDFVMCWTHDGDANTGGTGFAKKVAIDCGVPVHDLWHDAVLDQTRAWLARNDPRV